ncbi:MAG TPA: ABC transporter substrate-binding protein, partial [Ilumatobacteraceae bacterium]|nr:ABC transporter substrate-binding protein [Ilumatobacteraceae bacterium]
GPGDAKGATEHGVTDSEIVIGTASDVGNTVVPGLNQELWDSADAFVGWCNAAGGINGRKIKLIKHDAKLFEAGARMVDACQTDFMLVGGGMALDDTAVDQRLACGLAQVNGYVTGANASVAPMQLSPMPVSSKWSEVSITLRLIAAKDAATKRVGIWSSQVPSIQPAANRARRAVAAAGFTEAYFEELPAAVDNWRPLIEQLKAADVQILTMYNTPENLASAMRTMNDVGYFPKYVILGANHYNPKLIAEAGDALAKTTVLIYTSITPFEQASNNPATQQYIDLLKQYAGGASPKSLGINGFSAWLLFAESAKACGSDLTRACVMEKAKATKDWTGGGLHSQNNPGTTEDEAPQCFTLLQATTAGFVLNTDMMTPNKGIFNCDPLNAAHLPDA